MTCFLSMSDVYTSDILCRGGFEMWENGKLLGPCDGIQAHLSTLASPKVLELVPKLSPRILVEKVPRLSTWPTQFLENHATEDNIALYFFAENLERFVKTTFQLR